MAQPAGEGFVQPAVDAGETKPILAKIARTSRTLEVIFFVLGGFFCAAGVALIVVSLVSGAGSGGASELVGLLSFLNLFIYSAILFCAGMVFRDTSRGGTPFTMKQARRIRIAAWLLLACALIESLIPAGVTYSQTVGHVAMDADHNASTPFSVELGPLVSALVFFFLSSVFKYGVKLQEFSDDVL